MNRIRFYILKQLSVTSFFTLICLLGVYGFFDIVNELSSVGKGSYQMTDLLIHVALLAPGHAYELMPLAVLIGVMVTMNQLSSKSEYTAIRTSGVSLAQIAATQVMFGLICALLAFSIGEWVAPHSEEYAVRSKLQKTQSLVASKSNTGAWAKDHNQFINVKEISPDNTLKHIAIYEFDDSSRLIFQRYAESATYLRDGVWELSNVVDAKITDLQIITTKTARTTWVSVLKPELLNVLLVTPEQMSAWNLVQYIQHLYTNKQESLRYEIALWGKLFYPLACLSMALIALAFTPTNQRNGEMGIKLFIGICIGIGFHFTNQLFSHLGLLYAWNPLFSSTTPTLLFLSMGILQIWRNERR